MSSYWENLQDLLATGEPFVSVTLVDVIASAPQNVGAKMLVTAKGLHFGTVGGGKIEARALLEAQKLLTESTTTGETRFVEWNLQTDIHMTCGGIVKLFFESYNHTPWPIIIFGAGHCSQALARLLLTLPCQITIIDSRPEWLAKLPPDPKLRPLLADQPLASYISALAPNSFILSMTMGHATDLPILTECLQSHAFPYLGAIGSDAKAATLKRNLLANGITPEKLATLLCPVGLDLGRNDPSEIAISIAAQLLQRRDALARPAAGI